MAKQQNQIAMLHCIKVHYFTFPIAQCKSYEPLLQTVAKASSTSVFNISLYYVDSKNIATLIESDSDLLSLKYISRQKSYKFKVEVRKGKEEIQQQTRNEVIGEYLSEMYDDVADAEIERQLKKISSDYLASLYEQIVRREEEEAARKIEEEQINRYMNKINHSTIGNHLLSKLPQPIRRNKSLRFSPERPNKRRETMIQNIVGKVLDDMLPMMVNQLTTRIMNELRRSKMEGNLGFEENPQEL